MQFINEASFSDIFSAQELFSVSEQQAEQRSVDININVIYEQIYNPKRFQEITVIVVDYTMPSMTGLELLAKINNPDIKKILLTGEADEKLATSAFNEGLIDKFIRKGSENFIDLINSAIKEMQVKVFLERSNLIINAIVHNPDALPNCITDLNFKKIFEQICNDNNIIEYYLLDGTGSYLLLNKNAKPYWLAVRSEEEMIGLDDAIKAYRDKVSAEITNAINKREKLLFSFTAEDFAKPAYEWLSNLHPATAFKSRNNEQFYYSLIHDTEAYQLQDKKIVSFEQIFEAK